MKKIVTASLLMVLPLLVLAKNPLKYEEATKACSAYNNMKHTQNSNEIKLKAGEKYRILERKEGQVLTLIEGERIAQRWVDESCFKPQSIGTQIVNSLNKKSKAKVTGKQNLLAISWQNAFCQTHQYKKECKRMTKKDFGASNFVLHGLWPQPRNNQYCNVSKKEVGMDKNKQWHSLAHLDLNATVRSELSKLMPGYHSNLHKHEWVKHGTCYGTNANEYYADAMNLLTQLNDSKVQDYFEKNIGKTIELKDIQKIFNEEFGQGSGEHVTMKCNQGLITELWLHLGSAEKDLKGLLFKGGKPKSSCYKGRVDAVGY
ncbi:hypothetical protein KKC13_00250 [bacterium]|nr:hypothetical protein [bacterium]MBU1956794.1 hypothetical protein [bacterium]